MIQPKLVVIGGGSGSFTILQELKHWAANNISAVVNMSDDGGSSSELRDELGVLPPGDIRQCLVALSNYLGSYLATALMKVNWMVIQLVTLFSRP